MNKCIWCGAWELRKRRKTSKKEGHICISNIHKIIKGTRNNMYSQYPAKKKYSRSGNKIQGYKNNIMNRYTLLRNTWTIPPATTCKIMKIYQDQSCCSICNGCCRYSATVGP